MKFLFLFVALVASLADSGLAAPVITGLEPAQISGSPFSQQITIVGSGFAPKGTKVIIRNSAGLVETLPFIQVLDPGHLVINYVVEDTPANWSVEVINFDASTSGVFAFTVGPPYTIPTISQLSPNPVTGGGSIQEFTITGTDFLPGAKIVLRDLTANQVHPDFLLVSFTATRIVMSGAFSDANHEWEVDVINPGTRSPLQLARQFSVYGASTATPELSKFGSRSFISTGALQFVTVEGRYFGADATVNLRNVTSGQIFANLPIFGTSTINRSLNFTFTEGEWTAEVTNPGAPSATSNVLSFTVLAPGTLPVLQTISPSLVNFTKRGTQQLILSGTGFTSGCVVTLTAPAPRGFAMTLTPEATATATSLTVQATLLFPGEYKLEVVNQPSGQLSNALIFTVRVPTPTTPLIARILPSAGVARSATPQNITILGKNFATGVRVYAELFVSGLASGPATELAVTSTSATSLSATGTFNPPNFSVYTIRLVNPNSEFAERELGIDDSQDPTAPKITALTPANLVVADTMQTLTLTGERFPAVPTVSMHVASMGSNYSPSFTVVSATSTQIVLSCLLSIEGDDYRVQVLDPATGKKSSLNFAVQPDPTAPRITGVSPQQPQSSTSLQTLTLTGLRFPNTPIISVAAQEGDEEGGDEAFTIVSKSSTRIDLRGKLRFTGPYIVTVYDEATDKSGDFEFVVLAPLAARITSLAPAAPLASPTAQTLTFTALRLPSPYLVTFTNNDGDDIPFTLVSATGTKVVLQTVLNAPVRYLLNVSNVESGESADFAFTAIADTPPSITSVSPGTIHGSEAAQTLTIRGTAFAPGAQVTVRDESAGVNYTNRSIVSFDPAKITIHEIFGIAAHDWSVKVINPDGQSSSRVAFRVTLPPETPTIASVLPSPITGARGSQPFTITGTKFAEGATVHLYDLTSREASTEIPVSLSSTEITVSARFGVVAHEWSVKVVNADGGTSAAFHFSVLAKPGSTAPAITGVSPNPLPGSNSDQTFTINGAGFLPGCEITFRDVTSGQIQAARIAKTFSANQLIIKANFTTAAHDWTVEVTNLNGEKSGQYAFSVTAPAAVPSISNVQPDPVIGSNSPQDFVILGTGYLATSTVTLRDLSTGQIFLNVPIASKSATELVVRPIFTTATHRWSVEVVNAANKNSTGQYAFEVRTPAGSQPDLAPSGVTLETAYEAGESATVTWIMTNTGSTIANSSTVRLSLSVLGIEALDEDPVLGTVTTLAIPTGGSVEQSATITLPPNTQAGTFHICVLAMNVPNEGATGNNAAFSAPFTITGLAAPATTPHIASMTPAPIVGSTRLQTVRLSGTNLGVKTKISFKNTNTNKVTVRPVKLQSDGNVTATMTFGALASDWIATAVNPGNQLSGAFPFNVLDNASGFSLIFPLPDLTPSTAHFSTVFDHASRTPFKPGTVAEGTVGVVSFTDERGTVQEPAATIVVKGASLFSFKKGDASAFDLRGLYKGVSASSLSFDSNPGYDFPIAENTDVLAAAAGKIYTLKDANHTIYIDHTNGYRTYYLNCASMVSKSGKVVQPGEIIAKSGNAGAATFSLHFEVRKQINGKWVPVDPYGWESADGNQDPYAIPGVSTVDSLNANLWAP